MNKLIAVLPLLALLFAACVPRANGSADLTRVNQQRELALLGSWRLVQLSAGGAPAPNERRTLTFQNNGVLLEDRWEHRLTYNYAVAPDAAHLTLRWTASTNPNDKPSGSLVQSFSIHGDNLILNGDFFRRLALASGATLTPDGGTPGVETTAPPSASAVPVTRQTGRALVTLGAPFTLRAGERALVTDSPNQFGIQFYAVSKDSRCPSSVDCVTAGEATVQITFEENGLLHPQVIELTTTPAGSVKATEGYIVTLVSLEPYPQTTTPIPQSEYAATFVITVADGTPTAPPTPISQTRCPHLTAADAQAILGEPVRAQPSSEIIIRAEQEASALEVKAYGLCGYLSEASAVPASIPSYAPRVVAPAQSAHAVTAGRLRGGGAVALVRIADILRAANPGGDENRYLILLTRLLAGDNANTASELRDLAAQAPNVKTAPVPLGEDAAWIWYPYEGGRYAALVVRQGSDFIVVQAVGGDSMTEARAQEAMTAVAENLLE